jgi:hypothetical protein
MYLYRNLNMRARFEPIDAPVSTIGASDPTDPPKPMVNELAIIDE